MYIWKKILINGGCQAVRSVHAWYMYSSSPPPPTPPLLTGFCFCGVSRRDVFFSFFYFRCTIYRWWHPADFAIEWCLLGYAPRDDELGIESNTWHVPHILLYLFNLTVLIYVFLLADARFISFLSISCIFHVGEDG